MQKDHLLSNLTVDEYMTAAAHLKLGNGVSNQEKQCAVSFDLPVFRENYLFITCNIQIKVYHTNNR